MRSRRKKLLALTALTALVSAALYSACFKPELDIEAFRCNSDDEACPEGYVCHKLTPVDWRCFKEGHAPPTPELGLPDMGQPDMDPLDISPPVEGPPIDAGLKLTCTGPTTVVATDLGGAALVLDQQGEPIVVYRNASGIHHKNGKGHTWSAPNLVSMMPYNFAATVDDQDRLHVVYTDATSKTLYHCLRQINSTTCLITKKFAEADLANVKELTSFDIASAGGETWAAVGITDASNQHKGVLLEVKPNGPPVTDINYGKFKCDQKTAVGNPTLLEADIAVSPGHVVASYWLDATGAQGFRVFSYPLNLTLCAQGKENPLLTTKLPVRMPVAIGSGGMIHAAHGNHGPNLGLVHHYDWPFKSPFLMLPSQKYEAWSDASAKPESVDMTLSGDVPVISLLSDHTGQLAPVLLFRDPKAPGGWLNYSLPKLLPGQVAGAHTRVAVRNRRVHVLFDGAEKGKSSLFHIECEGDLPK
jgi:hypothetical protein